jgi:hypothetical protein
MPTHSSQFFLRSLLVVFALALISPVFCEQTPVAPLVGEGVN